MDNNQTHHPNRWSTEELMTYMHEIMHWNIDVIASKTREEMVAIVERDEWDKE